MLLWSPAKKKKRGLRDNGGITSLTLLHPLPGMLLWLRWTSHSFLPPVDGAEKMFFSARSKYRLFLETSFLRAEDVCCAATKRGARFPLFWLAGWPQRWTWLANWQWSTGGECWHSDPISWQPFQSGGISCLPEEITPGIATIALAAVSRECFDSWPHRNGWGKKRGAQY